MTRYSLVHRTSYAYQSPVERSYGRAHLKPGDETGQRCLNTTLEIVPPPSDISDHVDYFGNISTFYLVRRRHTSLTVTARSELEVSREAPSTAVLTALDDYSWEQLRGQLPEHHEVVEYCLPSTRIKPSTAVSSYAKEIFTPGRAAGEVIADLCHRINTDFQYRSGSTTVATTIEQLLRQRTGVCQDFAHLAVGCLRSVGLAARYVSGYLETSPPPGRPKLQGADASHAWASVFVPELGWIDFDPTNDQWVDGRYLVVARGRDYGDVPPLKGVIVTDSARSNMTVNVDVTKLS
ncbi:transglutaminase family protein [Jatrophihabitans sp. DSM 45814]